MGNDDLQQHWKDDLAMALEDDARGGLSLRDKKMLRVTPQPSSPLRSGI